MKRFSLLTENIFPAGKHFKENKKNCTFSIPGRQINFASDGISYFVIR